MKTGTVKKIVREKGFGFVRGDDGKEYFFHKSACDPGEFDKLLENDAVDFDIEEKNPSPKGPRAARVIRHV
jgi:CspA family cold shock protein